MSSYTPLTDEDISDINHLFDTVVIPVMTEEHASEDGRSGAVLDVRDRTDETLLHVRSGSAPEDKFQGYHQNARDKNAALEANEFIFTSFEVHQGDLTQKPYPGAIRTNQDDRFSISGFTWERDMVGCLFLAHRAGRIGLMDAANLATTCGIRPQFVRLMHKLNAYQRSLVVAA